MQHFHTGNLQLTTAFTSFSFQCVNDFFFPLPKPQSSPSDPKLKLWTHKKESHLSDADCQIKSSVKQHFPQTVNTRNI